MLTAHAPLDSLNTFGLTARAAWLLELNQLSDLDALRQPELAELPRLILGGGSNLLFSTDFQGVVIQNRLRGISVVEEADHWLLHVAAGENWHELIRWSLERGMAGMENLALIPGTVGAAPVQNIGAYGSELAHFCRYVEVADLNGGAPYRLEAAECGFGYRESIFKHAPHNQLLITAVGLALPKIWQPNLSYGPLAALGEAVTPQAIFDTVCATRMAKLPDPKVLGNAGSFFKNPVCTKELAETLRQSYPTLPCYPAGDAVKVAAGWLIDQCGLKGEQLGGAMVHTEQALVLVNRGGATASDIIALAQLVCDRVAAKFGIRLEPEVRLIGATGERMWSEVLA